MDKATQEAFLKLRQRFITEDGFNGSQYQDGVDALLPDRSSLAWKTWTSHGNALSNAYEIIVIDGKSGEWPEVRAACSASCHPLIMIGRSRLCPRRQGLLRLGMHWTGSMEKTNEQRLDYSGK
jgi:hypothetical protein